MKKNEIYEGTIEQISSDGNGVAKIDGYCVFVPDTAVGDRLKIRVVKDMKSYAFGKAEQILMPSEDRISDSCPVSVRCGGCCLRHLKYSCELQAKQEIVISALTRIGGLAGYKFNHIMSGNPEHYRNKAQYPVAEDKNGKLYAGFYAKRTHDVVKQSGCSLEPVIFSEIVERVCTLLTERKVRAYNEITGKGMLRHIYLRCSDSGEIMVCLVLCRENFPDRQGFLDKLVSDFPCICSVVININSKKTNVILGDRYITVYGNNSLCDTLCGVEFTISPASFYQVNHDMAQRLYGEAARMACLKKSDTLLDLYCGAGTIGLSLAKKVGRVVGIEIVPQAIENAIENAKRNEINNAVFFASDSVNAKQILDREGIAPDCVIMDPPRAGCEKTVIDAVVGYSPKKIVYVSCNPATLARDLKYFGENGYITREVTPADMFPRTVHVETVALLTR